MSPVVITGAFVDRFRVFFSQSDSSETMHMYVTRVGAAAGLMFVNPALDNIHHILLLIIT